MTKHCTYVAGCPLLLGKLAADLQQGEDSIISLHCAKQAWISHCAAVKSTSLCCSALSNCLLSSGIPLTKSTFGTLHYSRYLALILSLCQFPLCCIFKMHFCRVTIALHTVHSLFALIGPKDLGGL